MEHGTPPWETWQALSAGTVLDKVPVCWSLCSEKASTQFKGISVSSPVYLTKNLSTSTLLSQLLPSVFVDCVPTPLAFCPFPLMDFH